MQEPHVSCLYFDMRTVVLVVTLLLHQKIISHGLQIAVPVLSSDAVYLLGLYDFCILLPQSGIFLSKFPSREQALHLREPPSPN